RLLPAGRWRQSVWSIFGPLSVFGLIIVWAAGLIAGFGLLHWSAGTGIAGAEGRFSSYLYFSAVTFFTLSDWALTPTSACARGLSVAEAGTGFVSLAVVISYLPVLYQAFSRREITISLFDARAGSPPTASELLRRLADGHGAVHPFLVEWERWA